MTGELLYNYNNKGQSNYYEAHIINLRSQARFIITTQIDLERDIWKDQEVGNETFSNYLFQLHLILLNSMKLQTWETEKTGLEEK